MGFGGEERQQGSTAGFLLQLFCSVQGLQGDIQVLCCCRHSGRAHRHDLIQVVSGHLMVSFARTNYFLGWHRNWYRLGRKSGWVRSNFSCECLLDITQPNLDLRTNGDLQQKTMLFIFKNIQNSNIKEATASSLEQFSECFQDFMGTVHISLNSC